LESEQVCAKYIENFEALWKQFEDEEYKEKMVNDKINEQAVKIQKQLE